MSDNYIYGYARVSTQNQDLIRQLDLLKQHKCTEILTEKYSGTKAERPELKRLKDKVRRGDTIIIESFSRLGRSTKDLIELVEYFESKGVELISIKENFDTNYKDKYRETVLVKGRSDEKVVALTFDDGPDGRITPMILDILKANNVYGNFFFLGQYVKKYPAVVKRADAEGNLVLNHSNTHPQWTNASEQSVLNEISITDDSIQQLIGKTPTLVRPPYGITNNNVVDAARSKGDKLVIWSVDSLDWKYRNASRIVQNVMSTVHSGDIILMHSDGDKIETVKALQEVINQLSKQGYKIVTLDYLLSVNAYK